MGVVDSGREDEKGEGWWEYRLDSGEVFSVPPDSVLPCGTWLVSTTTEASPDVCAVVALVDDTGVASFVEDLEIPQGEDAELYATYTDGRQPGPSTSRMWLSALTQESLPLASNSR